MEDKLKQLNEDMASLAKLVSDPQSIDAISRVQEAVYAILFGLAQLGKTYPTLRFAIRKSIMQYLRDGW